MSLKAQLRQASEHIVLPGGAGATSAEACQTGLTVTRPEIQRRLDTAVISHGALAILQPTAPCTAPLIEEQATVQIAGRLQNYISTLAVLLPDAESTTSIHRATAIFGLMVGTLQLAREVPGAARAEQILEGGVQAALHLAETPRP